MEELRDLEIYNPVKTGTDIYYSKVMSNSKELTIQVSKNTIKLNKDKMKAILTIDADTSEFIKKVSDKVIKNTSKQSSKYFGKQLSEQDCESIYKEAAKEDKLYCFYDENTQFYTSQHTDLNLDDIENELTGIAMLKCNAIIYTKSSFFIRWEVSQFKIKRDKIKEAKVKDECIMEYIIRDLPEHSEILNDEIRGIESKLENITLF